MLLEYQRQDSRQTLQEGIEEYAVAFDGQLTLRVLSPDGQSFFRCHDVVHVVFGCGLSLEDEAVVKVSSFFGTTGGSAVMRGYRLPESREIYGELRIREILTTTARSFVLVPRTIRRCLRMAERWPWDDFDDYLHTPLGDIRRQFRILVAH